MLKVKERNKGGWEGGRNRDEGRRGGEARWRRGMRKRGSVGRK